MQYRPKIIFYYLSENFYYIWEFNYVGAVAYFGWFVLRPKNYFGGKENILSIVYSRPIF